MSKQATKRVTVHDFINVFRGVLHLEKAHDQGNKFTAEFSAHGKRVYATKRKDGVIYVNVNGASAVIGTCPHRMKAHVMGALRHG